MSAATSSSLSSAPPPLIPPSSSFPAKWRPLVGCWSRRSQQQWEEILTLQGDFTFHFVRIVGFESNNAGGTDLLTVGTWGPLTERGLIVAKSALSDRGGFAPRLRQLAKATSRSSGSIKECTEHPPELSISFDATFKQGTTGPHPTAPSRMQYPFFLSRKDQLIEYSDTEVIFTRTRSGHYFRSRTITDSMDFTRKFRLSHCQDQQQTANEEEETNRENEIEEKEETKQPNEDNTDSERCA